jgi:hypothetical protein
MARVSEFISDEAVDGVWNCLGKHDINAWKEGAIVEVKGKSRSGLSVGWCDYLRLSWSADLTWMGSFTYMVG